MHKIVVLYPHPDNPDAFMAHYERQHLALVKRLPGLMHYSYGRVEALGSQAPEHFLSFEAIFTNRESMAAALASTEGQNVVEDVPNYSPKGYQMLHFDVITSTNS